MVTHRIHDVTPSPSGGVTLRTKGDANDYPDSWTYTPTRATLPRVDFHVPYVGKAYVALTDRRNRIVVLGLPALLIALSIFTGLWRDAGRASQVPA